MKFHDNVVPSLSFKEKESSTFLVSGCVESGLGG